MSKSLLLFQQQIANGNQSAYKSLFLLYYKRLLRFANNFTHSREIAEEIVSDVFINLWKKRTSITVIDNLHLYLYVAVRNTALNYLQQLNRQRWENLDEVSVELSEPFADPETALVTSELSNRIKRAIQQLPSRCKLIFQLVKEDGLSYKETAQLLQISVNTVDNQLVIALQKIASVLQFSFSKKV
jgi:RNA polymerase sigma-70 factor (ECF subfamily)